MPESPLEKYHVQTEDGLRLLTITTKPLTTDTWSVTRQFIPSKTDPGLDTSREYLYSDGTWRSEATSPESKVTAWFEDKEALLKELETHYPSSERELVEFRRRDS